MLKTIHKNELRLGMYILDLNRGWLDHPFLRGSFMLRSEADLARILASSVAEVRIDTLKGLDVAGETAPPWPAGFPDPAPARTSHAEELETALRIREEAGELIRGMLLDARMGRQVQVERLHPVVERITRSILRNPGTLVSLCRIREADGATFRHSLSACALMILFGHHLKLEPEALREAGMAGMLHDIGKMRVPDAILNKPGSLSEPEFEIMKSHVPLGLETLRQTPGISPSVIQVAAEHHERMDGSGYPAGLRGDAISRLGRMAAIIDVYDAITSIRVYYHGIEPAAALQHLFQRGTGQFDGDLVEHFIQAIGIYPVGSLVRLASGRLAVVLEQQQDGLLRPKVRVLYDLRQDRALEPFDLDLAQEAQAGDSILGHEEPWSWAVDPAAALTRVLPIATE